MKSIKKLGLCFFVFCGLAYGVETTFGDIEVDTSSGYLAVYKKVRSVKIEGVTYPIERYEEREFNEKNGITEEEVFGLGVLFISSYSFIQPDFLKACFDDNVPKDVMELGYGKGSLYQEFLSEASKRPNVTYSYYGIDYYHENFTQIGAVPFPGNVKPYLALGKVNLCRNLVKDFYKKMDCLVAFHFLHCLKPCDFIMTLKLVADVIKQGGKAFLTLHSTHLSYGETLQQKSYMGTKYDDRLINGDELPFWVTRAEKSYMTVDPYNFSRLLEKFGFKVDVAGFYEQDTFCQKTKKKMLLQYTGFVATRLENDIDEKELDKLKRKVLSKFK